MKEDGKVSKEERKNVDVVFIKERNIWIIKEKKKKNIETVGAIQRAMLHLKFQWGRYFATCVSLGTRSQLKG